MISCRQFFRVVLKRAAVNTPLKDLQLQSVHFPGNHVSLKDVRTLLLN